MYHMIRYFASIIYKIYVSFSGGKDSTVLLDLVRKIYPDAPAVFFDTGLEYPELRSYVKTIDNVEWIKPSMTFRKVIETYGYPLVSKEVSKRVHEYHNAEVKGRLKQSNAYKEFNGLLLNKDGDPSAYNKTKWGFLVDADFKISHKCCDIMKKKPAYEYERRTCRKPIVGTMACESRIRKQKWLEHGCNAFDGSRIMSQPMSFWTEQDVLAYIHRFRLSFAPVYGEILQDENGRYYNTGCRRTGCVFCAYGVHLEPYPNRFQNLKQTHPKLWAYCMKPWNEGGLGMQKVLEYIHVDTE